MMFELEKSERIVHGDINYVIETIHWSLIRHSSATRRRNELVKGVDPTFTFVVVQYCFWFTLNKKRMFDFFFDIQKTSLKVSLNIYILPVLFLIDFIGMVISANKENILPFLLIINERFIFDFQKKMYR